MVKRTESPAGPPARDALEPDILRLIVDLPMVIEFFDEASVSWNKPFLFPSAHKIPVAFRLAAPLHQRRLLILAAVQKAFLRRHKNVRKSAEAARPSTHSSSHRRALTLIYTGPAS